MPIANCQLSTINCQLNRYSVQMYNKLMSPIAFIPLKRVYTSYQNVLQYLLRTLKGPVLPSQRTFPYPVLSCCKTYRQNRSAVLPTKPAPLHVKEAEDAAPLSFHGLYRSRYAVRKPMRGGESLLYASGQLPDSRDRCIRHPQNSRSPKIKEKAKTEALVLDHKEDRYPVQQVATDGEVTKKEVKDAVKEINPDLNSLGSRG